MTAVLLTRVLIFGAIISEGQSFTSINNKLHEAHFEYPGPAISERDLPICPQNAVCSVVHRRYWMPRIVKRLCRCSKRIECPDEWTEYPDNYTMHLDNRSQFKFCDEVSALPQCGQGKTALTVTTTNTKETKSTLEDTSPTQKIEEERKLAVNVSCHCPLSFAWQELPQKKVLQSPENGTIIETNYQCKPMQKCSSFDFCGNMRADYFSTYYHCSCPMAHLCLNQNRTITMANELLYDGQVYQAFCYPQTQT